MKGTLPTSIALLCFALLCPPSARSASPSPTPAPAWPLPPLDYFVGHLAPPPRPGSFRDRMDLSDAIARQKSTTSDDLDSVQQTYLFNVFYFSTALGPNFTAKNYPKTAAFFSKLTGSANIIVSGLKEHYQRPRPIQAYPDQIKLLVRNEPGFGYPSGHTTRSRLCALVLASLAPQYKSQLFAASQQVATDRILAGEHYLTDLEAGRHLAKMLFALLCEDMQFQADLSALKAAEWSPSATSLGVAKQ